MRETRLWSWHLLVIPIIIVLLGALFAVMHYAPVFLWRECGRGS